MPRVATDQGAFSVEQHPGSWLTSTEYIIVYQKTGSSDRAVIIYNRRDGPVTVETQIT